MEHLLGKSITQYEKHLNNVLQRNSAICRGEQGRIPSVLSVSGSRFHTSNGSEHAGILEHCVCFSKHLIYAVLPQIQWEENVQLCKNPAFCLAPKLLSAAEFRFSHLTLHCLFFRSLGVEEH